MKQFALQIRTQTSSLKPQTSPDPFSRWHHSKIRDCVAGKNGTWSWVRFILSSFLSIQAPSRKSRYGWCIADLSISPVPRKPHPWKTSFFYHKKRRLYRVWRTSLGFQGYLLLLDMEGSGRRRLKLGIDFGDNISLCVFFSLVNCGFRKIYLGQ